MTLAREKQCFGVVEPHLKVEARFGRNTVLVGSSSVQVHSTFWVASKKPKSY